MEQRGNECKLKKLDNNKNQKGFGSKFVMANITKKKNIYLSANI